MINVSRILNLVQFSKWFRVYQTEYTENEFNGRHERIISKKLTIKASVQPASSNLVFLEEGQRLDDFVVAFSSFYNFFIADGFKGRGSDILKDEAGFLYDAKSAMKWERYGYRSVIFQRLNLSNDPIKGL